MQLTKEVYDSLTDEQKKKIPIIGSMIDWEKVERAEPEPNRQNFNNEFFDDFQYVDGEPEDLPY